MAAEEVGQQKTIVCSYRSALQYHTMRNQREIGAVAANLVSPDSFKRSKIMEKRLLIRYGLIHTSASQAKNKRTEKGINLRDRYLHKNHWKILTQKNGKTMIRRSCFPFQVEFLTYRADEDQCGCEIEQSTAKYGEEDGAWNCKRLQATSRRYTDANQQMNVDAGVRC